MSCRCWCAPERYCRCCRPTSTRSPTTAPVRPAWCGSPIGSISSRCWPFRAANRSARAYRRERLTSIEGDRRWELVLRGGADADLDAAGVARDARAPVRALRRRVRRRAACGRRLVVRCDQRRAARDLARPERPSPGTWRLQLIARAVARRADLASWGRGRPARCSRSAARVRRRGRYGEQRPSKQRASRPRPQDTLRALHGLRAKRALCSSVVHL